MTNTDAAAASPTTTTAAAPATAATAAAPATDTAATCTTTAAKFSISAMADTIVKIITALVIAKCWYIGWAFRWVVETPLSCLAKTLLIMFFTALALHTRRIYPQVILGLIWFTVFSSYSIFADKIIFNYNGRGYAIGFCFLMLYLSIPVMLNVLYRKISDTVNNIRHAAVPSHHKPQKNCKADTLPQTTRLSLGQRFQPCFRLTIVILCVFAMLIPEFKSGAALLTTCLIIGVCAELIFFYKPKKTILPPQTQTAKQTFGNASANNIAQPVSTNSTSANSPHPNAPQNFDARTSRSPQNFDALKNSAPLLPAQQSLLQRSSRCLNFFLHAIGFIILFILYTFAAILITSYGFEMKDGEKCIGNCYSPTVVEHRF